MTTVEVAGRGEIAELDQPPRTSARDPAAASAKPDLTLDRWRWGD